MSGTDPRPAPVDTSWITLDTQRTPWTLKAAAVCAGISMLVAVATAFWIVLSVDAGGC